jgi:hypothetical protein
MTDSPQNSQVAASAQTSQTAATPASEMPATPVSQTAATPVPDARVPRTHTSPAIIQMLKNLPLVSILQMNKEIEEKNAARSRKTFDHISDPTVHTEPGSDEASLVSLDDADLNRFRIPSFVASFPNLIYAKLAKWIADEEIKDKQKSKRKTADDVKLSAEEARIAKRRCMNGQKMVPWVVGTPWQATFPQSLFDTELCIAVPLPFFLNKNLNILNVEASTLPTTKTNPNPGEAKGTVILDVEKLSTRFGKELSLSCSQWTEAAGNMYLFQKERDEEGTADAHSNWYNDHFCFYTSQDTKDDLYDAWKPDELKFRQEHWAKYGEYDASRYYQAYKLSEKQREMMSDIRGMMAPEPTKTPFTGKLTPRLAPRPSQSRPSQPFSTGSGRSSSSTPDCLICAERGHDATYHADTTIVVKFKSDGKIVWAKYSDHNLLSPDNKVICISWNLRGERGHPCSHKDDRAHLCSFCGSKRHHAFSWTCRPRPSN